MSSPKMTRMFGFFACVLFAIPPSEAAGKAIAIPSTRVAQSHVRASPRFAIRFALRALR
jgi:hypothetical protein